MKQLFFYFLLALCCINIKVKAQSCALDLVGTTTVSSNSALADMAIDASNKVYSLAFNSATKVIELKSATISTSWTLVTTVPTVTNTTVKPALAINKIGEIIAFIRDEPNGKVGKVYKSTGGAFTQIGGAISVGPVSDLSIAFSATNEIYIAYTDVTPSNLATVKRWNGSAWLNVGTGGIASSGASKFNSLIIDNTNTPILAYQDGAAGFATTVSKFDGTNWNPLFTSASGATSNTTLRCATNGDYYLGYIEGSDASVVQKYDGSFWNQLGFNITGLSSGAGNYEMGIDPANSPYIIATTTSSMVTAYRFDGGTGWIQVPAGFINTNISTMVNIAFDKFGAPYFGYVDIPNNNALNVKTLSSLVSITTQPNSTTLCNGSSGSFSITTGGPGSPIYNWQSNNSSGFLDVISPYSPSLNILNIIANPTVNQDKIRCVVDIGCRNVISNTATLTVNTLSISTTFTNPTCFNTGNGSINASVSGGNSPYSYTWSPVGGNVANPTSLFWNTYTLNTSDINGCVSSTVVTLSSPPSINTSFSGNMSICNGSNTTLTVTASGGTGSFTYSWSPSGSISSPTSSVVIANPSSTQTYNVQVTDGIGCVGTNTVMVTVNTPPTISASAGPSTICNGNSTTLSATGVGVDTYVWNPGSLNGASQVVSPSSTTIYTVVGTNTLTGCSATSTIAITVNALPTVNAGPSGTLTCSNPTYTLSGSTTGGVTYSWVGPGIISGGTTLNPVVNAVGGYDLTVTSAAGCVAGPSPVVISQNTVAPSPSASTSGTLTCSTLTVALNGTPGTGVSYLWSGPGVSGSPTTQNTNANAAGSYTLKVTDAVNGCTNTAVTSVTQNTTTPTVSASSNTTSICAGASATLSASGIGVNTYVWNPGNLSGATQTVTPSSTTIYTITGTNSSTGCSATSTIGITVNALPTITAGPTKSITCAGTFTTVTCSSIGGASYNWNGPGIVSGYTTTNCNVNAVGIYTVFAISAFGCNSSNATVTVVQNTVAPSPTASSSGSLTCSNLSVNLNGTPGTGVTYLWSGPSITGATTLQNTTADAAGTYTLKVTSTVNSCTNIATTTVTQNTTAPNPFASSSGTITCSTPTVTLTALPASGVTYTWTGPGSISGPNTQSPIANAGGNYTLSITSLTNGCSNIFPITVNSNTVSPTVIPTMSGSLTCTTNTITAYVTTTTTPVTYNWTGTGILTGATTATITTNTTGIKNYLVTDANNGCSTYSNVVVVQNTVSPTLTTSNGAINCFTSTTTAGVGTIASPVTYTWSGAGIISASNIATITVNQGGTYGYSVTNTSNGCTTSNTLSVATNTVAPSVTSSVSNTITCTTTTANAIATTLASPVTFTWTGTGIISGAATPTLLVNNGGTKNYTVTNTSNGCKATGTLTVSQNTTSPIGLTAGANQTITCASPSVALSGNISAPGNATFNWAGGVCGSTTSSITSACAAGVYTLTATDPFNGCTSSSSVQVLVNAGVPVISANSNGTLTCVNINVNAIATTTVVTVDYLWSGPGIISGANTATATVNQPGNYSVTVTNTVSGCSANSSVNIIQDIVTPTLTLSASPSTICAGSSSTLSATGSASVTYNWLPGSLSGAIQTVSPASSSQYTATAINSINGCATSETIALVVNSNPTITVSGNMNICKGSSTNLTANGATTYTWNSGANTSSISVSPSVTTNYSVDGDNGNGCISSIPVTVSIIPNKTINGVITNTAGATSGDLTLYRYTSFLSHWDSVTTVPLSSSYSFNNIDSALYVIRAVPSATNIQVTYADSSISWQGATIINHGCTNNTSQNIKLIALQNFILGPGVITGTIVEGDGFVPKMSNEFKPLAPGGPIGGIVVKGGKNPGGQMLVQTITNASGQYTLSGLPLNTGNESYFVFVDIPGLDTNGTYHVVISGPDTVYTGLNFNVDSMYINPIGTITSISNENSIVDNSIYLYPNPTKDVVNIKYELNQPANVSIELFNIIGEKIEEISPYSLKNKNMYQYTVNLEQLNSGMYFVKIRVNSSEKTVKLIKN